MKQLKLIDAPKRNIRAEVKARLLDYAARQKARVERRARRGEKRPAERVMVQQRFQV